MSICSTWVSAMFRSADGQRDSAEKEELKLLLDLDLRTRSVHHLDREERDSFPRVSRMQEMRRADCRDSKSRWEMSSAMSTPMMSS